MNEHQASVVLALASTLDVRLTPPSHADGAARSKAWAATLNPEMTPEFAADFVRRHYATSTETIMPAHLNEAWKVHRRQEAEALEREALTSGKGVPMPPEIRRQLDALMRKHQI